jgi:hypothetical protein
VRVLLCIALSLPFAAAQSARVEGKVVSDTGEAVAKAVVQIAEGGALQNVKSAATDKDGRFVFDDLSVGQYRLWVDTGRLVSPDNMVAITLTAGLELKDLVLKLASQGAISGKVTDQDGDPVAGAGVVLLQYSYAQGRRELRQGQFRAITDDRGDYRIGNVPQGRYYVGATQQPAASFGDLGRAATDVNLSTFYPSAPDAASASQLDLTQKREFRGIDVRLRRAKVYTVKGRAVYADSRSLLTGGNLELVPPNTDPLNGVPFGLRGSLAPIQADGTFEFRNVVPGNYVVVPDPGPSATGERIRFQLGPQVTVSGSNIEGLTIPLNPAGPITGTVVTDEGDLQTLLKSKAPRISIALLPSEGLGGSPTRISTKDDGTFQFPTAGAAKYWWNVPVALEEVYVKAASFDEKDVTHALLDNSTGKGGVLRIVLSSKASSLSGTAPKGTTVRVWPKIPNLRDMQGGMKSVAADQNGGVRLGGLAPGEYYVAAWKELESGLAESPEFLARFNGEASLVELDEGGHDTVEVRLISPERVAAEIARLQ